MERAVFFVMLLQSAFLMTACGGGGGGGGSSSTQAFGNRDEVDFRVQQLARVRQLSTAEATFGDGLGQAGNEFADEVVRSTGDNIVFQTSDAAITTVELDRVERASDPGVWDFTLTRETALSTVSIQVEIEDGDDSIIETGDDNSLLYFTGQLLPGITDWLYSGAWLYTPTGSDQVTVIAIAGSDNPFPAADLGALTVVARYGSRGVGGNDVDDIGFFEAVGLYAGPGGTAEPFVANALLEANFVTDRINGVIESITTSDGRSYNFELNLEAAVIENLAGGFFAGNTNGQGGSIDDWTGNWGGKFHGKVRDSAIIQGAAPELIDYFNNMRNVPFAVSGTFGARDPDDTSQSIVGVFSSGFNVCTLRRDTSLPADAADVAAASGVVTCPTL